MGLDMFLYRRTYVKNWDFKTPEKQIHIKIESQNKAYSHIKTKNISYIEEEIMYWRKANHIHAWFVDLAGGEDDCQKIHLGVEDLAILQDKLIQTNEYLDTLERTEENQHGYYEFINVDQSKVLKTASGFFFGSTSYDKWYYDINQHTIKVLEELINDYPDDGWGFDTYYQASW